MNSCGTPKKDGGFGFPTVLVVEAGRSPKTEAALMHRSHLQQVLLGFSIPDLKGIGIGTESDLFKSATVSSVNQVSSQTLDILECSVKYVGVCARVPVF